MTYLVDTDWFIDYLRGREEARDLLDALRPSGIAVSLVTYAEVYEGVATSPRRDEHLQKVDDFLAGVELLGIDVAVARIFGERRAALRAQGLLIDNFDLLIAATALRFDLTLVTRNARDFRRVAGLQLYEA